jgi:hypothetical protein
MTLKSICAAGRGSRVDKREACRERHITRPKILRDSSGSVLVQPLGKKRCCHRQSRQDVVAVPIAAALVRPGRGQLGGLAAGRAIQTRHLGMQSGLEREASKVAEGAAGPAMNSLIRDGTAGANQRGLTVRRGGD